MRYDRSQNLTAEKVVNTYNEKDLADIIYKYGEERRSRRIARYICTARRKAGIRTGRELADIVSAAYGRRGRTHPATRTFQALRIAVNREMEQISAGLEAALSVLARGGRLTVITYHSLEDRLVKHFMREAAREGRVALMTKKPLAPGRDEIRRNPAARSAKLRVAEAV